MRLTKHDPTGSYWYLADGVSPASPLLDDNVSAFTPGISERDPQGTRYYAADAQGNSRALLDPSQSGTDGYNWDAFGNSVSRIGTNPTSLAWGEGSGYQTDSDSGLRLLGHRYYDSRTGRFISQDPAGDGDNWYAYAGNSPTIHTDPSGLWCPTPTVEDASGSWAAGQAAADDARATQAMAGMDLICEISTLMAKLSGKPFKTEDQAATAALESIYDRSVSEGWEYNGSIMKLDNGKFYVSDPAKSTEAGAGTVDLSSSFSVGMYHTHPPEVQGFALVFPSVFSPGDFRNANTFVHDIPGFRSYIENPAPNSSAVEVQCYAPNADAPAKSDKQNGPITSWYP